MRIESVIIACHKASVVVTVSKFIEAIAFTLCVAIFCVVVVIVVFSFISDKREAILEDGSLKEKLSIASAEKVLPKLVIVGIVKLTIQIACAFVIEFVVFGNCILSIMIVDNRAFLLLLVFINIFSNISPRIVTSKLVILGILKLDTQLLKKLEIRVEGAEKLIFSAQIASTVEEKNSVVDVSLNSVVVVSVNFPIKIPTCLVHKYVI